MICAGCGEPIQTGVVVYDRHRRRVVHTFARADLPRGAELRRLVRELRLSPDEQVVKGEPIIRLPDGRVYHERCWRG